MASRSTREDMASVFELCRADDWPSIFQLIQRNPDVSTTVLTMDNHITTTILHQAITSKGDTNERARVMHMILKQSPKAATIKNGYGSLPLHVISQRNTKIKSSIKESVMYSLIKAYPEALVEEGGVGKRTPLHIAFTDYISPQLAQHMIDVGKPATALSDKKGWLPVHVACSRHCSPEKLRMLLKANPASLHAKTNAGMSLMDLAKSTATKSHPNFCLIAELEKCFAGNFIDSDEQRDDSGAIRDAADPKSKPNMISPEHTLISESKSDTAAATMTSTTPSPSSSFGYGGRGHDIASSSSSTRKRKREVVDDSIMTNNHRTIPPSIHGAHPADLLLHFSRSNPGEHHVPWTNSPSEKHSPWSNNSIQAGSWSNNPSKASPWPDNPGKASPWPDNPGKASPWPNNPSKAAPWSNNPIEATQWSNNLGEAAPWSNMPSDAPPPNEALARSPAAPPCPPPQQPVVTDLRFLHHQSTHQNQINIPPRTTLDRFHHHHFQCQYDPEISYTPQYHSSLRHSQPYHAHYDFTSRQPLVQEFPQVSLPTERLYYAQSEHRGPLHPQQLPYQQQGLKDHDHVGEIAQV